MKFVMLRALGTSGKKKLFIIPYLFTFANASFGFLGIIKALEGNYIAAAYCIMAAGLMDMLDGRLARAFGSTSMLGMELDSLCDAISFCLAPTVVVYSWQLNELHSVGIMTLMMYLCAGLFRLAKFNITNVNQYRYFSGLPTPIAALFLISMVAYGYHFLYLPQALIILALLMISSIKFPTFKKNTRNNRIMRLLLASVIFSCIIGVILGYPVILATLSIYIIYCIVLSSISSVAQWMR